MKGHIEIVQERYPSGRVKLRVRRVNHRPGRTERMMWIEAYPDKPTLTLSVYGHEMLWAYDGSYTQEELLKVLTLVWNSPAFSAAWGLE